MISIFMDTIYRLKITVISLIDTLKENELIKHNI